MKVLKERIQISVLIIILFFSGSLFQLIPIYLLKLDINNLTVAQNVELACFSNTLVALIMIFIYRKDIKNDIKELKNNFWIIVEKSFKIWSVGIILMAISNLTINYFLPDAVANNEASIRNMITYNPYLMLINTSLLAPIIEELTFRKSFKDVFINRFAFVVISGFVFGALHVLPSVENVYDYLYLFPYCSLGIAFSYMYYKTNNICAPIIMHIFHNFVLTALSIYSLGIIL